MRVIRFTFHVALALEDDEGVATTAALLVADDSHPFDAPKSFEFTAEVLLCCVFVLRKKVVSRELRGKNVEMYQTSDE